MSSGHHCYVVYSTTATDCHGSVVCRSGYVFLFLGTRTVLTRRYRYRSRRYNWIRNRSDQSGLASLAIRIHHHRVRRRPQNMLTCRIACAVWAIVMGIIIPDSPYSTRYFSRQDRVIIQSRKRDDYHGVEKRQLRWSQVKESMLDVKTYLYFFLGLTANIPNGGTSNFGTLMTQGFGFNTLQTTLLQSRSSRLGWRMSLTSSPVRVVSDYLHVSAFHHLGLGLMTSLISIWVAAKTYHLNIRTYLMSAVTVITVVGFAMMAWGNNQATKLIGYCKSHPLFHADGPTLIMRLHRSLKCCIQSCVVTCYRKRRRYHQESYRQCRHLRRCCSRQHCGTLCFHRVW
jgi:hypothetical protein